MKPEPIDDPIFVSLIERDMAEGTKRLYSDLARYSSIKTVDLLAQSDHWRHKESQTVYRVIGTGLAATGNGKLALMVHYVPQATHCPERPFSYHERDVPVFERQYSFFLERFEPVNPRTVWDRA